jgi:hypothetical protein
MPIRPHTDTEPDQHGHLHGLEIQAIARAGKNLQPIKCSPTQVDVPDPIT